MAKLISHLRSRQFDSVRDLDRSVSYIDMNNDGELYLFTRGFDGAKIVVRTYYKDLPDIFIKPNQNESVGGTSHVLDKENRFLLQTRITNQLSYPGNPHGYADYEDYIELKGWLRPRGEARTLYDERMSLPNRETGGIVSFTLDGNILWIIRYPDFSRESRESFVLYKYSYNYNLPAPSFNFINKLTVNRNHLENNWENGWENNWANIWLNGAPIQIVNNKLYDDLYGYEDPVTFERPFITKRKYNILDNSLTEEANIPYRGTILGNKLITTKSIHNLPYNQSNNPKALLYPDENGKLQTIKQLQPYISHAIHKGYLYSLTQQYSPGTSNAIPQVIVKQRL